MAAQRVVDTGGTALLASLGELFAAHRRRRGAVVEEQRDKCKEAFHWSVFRDCLEFACEEAISSVKVRDIGEDGDALKISLVGVKHGKFVEKAKAEKAIIGESPAKG